MLKIEYIWRELLFQTIEKGNPSFTITKLAQLFSLSTSVVAYALFPLKELRMVEIGKIHSKVTDVERLLYFWATRRNLKKDLIYKTYSSLPIFERETLMPTNVLPTAYSAYRLYLDDIPSDYDKIYFYADDLWELKKRFPPMPTKNPNIFILKSDRFLIKYGKTPLSQIFADLWNLPEWYAKEFQEALLLKIKEKIGI